MEESKPISSPMVTWCKLSKDDESLEVDHTMYRSMIGSLLYVTTTIRCNAGCRFGFHIPISHKRNTCGYNKNNS